MAKSFSFSRAISIGSSMASRRRLLSTATETATETGGTETKKTKMMKKKKKISNEVKNNSLRYLCNKLGPLRRIASGVSKTLDGWVKEGKSVEKFEIVGLVDQLRQLKQYNHALKMVEWLDVKDWTLSHGDHELRLDLISKTKGIDSAEEYFNSLPDSAKNKYTYGALLHCYCQEKMPEKAMGVAQKMKELDYEFTSPLYTNLMSLYLAIREPGKVTALVQEMKDAKICLDIYTYNMWMLSCSYLKDIEGAERVLEEMKTSGVKCDSSTFVNLASIYVRTGLKEKAIWALNEIEGSIDAGVPDRKVLHTLISLYSSIQDKLAVDRVWQSLKSALPLNNLSYLTILQALSRLHDTDGLKKYFEEWESCRLPYDIRVANVLIESYLDRDMVTEAESVLEGAKKKGARSNLQTLVIFMKFFLKNCQMDLVLKCLDAACSKRKENEWKPSKELVSTLLDYFEQEKDIESAEMLVKSLKKVKYVDDRLYCSLLRTYIAAGREEPQMLQRITDDGIELSPEIQELLGKVCPNEGQFLPV